MDQLAVTGENLGKWIVETDSHRWWSNAYGSRRKVSIRRRRPRNPPPPHHQHHNSLVKYIRRTIKDRLTVYSASVYAQYAVTWTQ